MDLDRIDSAEKLSAFMTVTRSEAAYAHAWGSSAGYMDRYETSLVLAVPGRHEITLFEYASDLQLAIVSFYKPWFLKALRASSRVFGSDSEYQMAKAAMQSARAKLTALGSTFPRSAKRVIARAYPDHKQTAKHLTTVQIRDSREAVRAMRSLTTADMEAGRLEWQRFTEKLNGTGLPAADTVIDKSHYLAKRVYKSTGEEFPSKEVIKEFCTPLE